MGEVYRARDTRLGREVAIKIVGERASHDPKSLHRFEEEAKAVAALSDPNILAIHDFRTENGVSFAVMELLRGESLSGTVSRERSCRGEKRWRSERRWPTDWRVRTRTGSCIGI